MPNVGKPSKGCKNCRDRKVKCDQKRPSCSQCIRIQKECYGYRDPMEMMFRNESDVVARRAKIKYQELSRERMRKSQKARDARSSDDETAPSSSSSSSNSPPSHQLVVRSVSPATFLPPSIEDQGVSFFFSNFVQPPSLVPRGNFDFLPDLLSQPDADPVLQSSVTAAGLAGLAQATNSRSILKKAQEHYVAALTLTNQALATRETAVRDSTLISVIMLGLYENFQWESKDSLRAWAKHVNGACALIYLRGKDQLLRSVGHRIFQQFYGIVLLVSTEAGLPVPQEIQVLWELNAVLGEYKVMGKHWTTEMVRFLHRAIDVGNDRTSDPITLITTAIRLERELTEIESTTPTIWKPVTVYLEKPDKEVFSNYYHMYLDPWMVQMSNHFRSIRILLHWVIRKQLTKGLSKYPEFFTKEKVAAQRKWSDEVLRVACDVVCASVPQITGQVPFPDMPAIKPSMSTSFSDLFDPQDPKFKLRPRGTYLNPSRPPVMHYLIWPLYQAGLAEQGSNQLKEWVVEVFYFITRTIGTRQAVVLAEDLKEVANRGFVAEVED